MPVYHLVRRRDWLREPDADYQADSLRTEGFIHCSHAEQVARSANRFFADADDLVVLEIDAELLKSTLKDEPAGSGELFPHIYGPINRDAVYLIRALKRGADGQWEFGEGQKMKVEG